MSTVAKVMIVYFLLLSTILFGMMGEDKRRAQKGVGTRVPEKDLFKIALYGGAIGGVIGMYIWKHKTQHTSFKVTFPLFAIADIIFAIAIW